jgi:hypothetical protein
MAMQLKEFVENALIDILSGISSARSHESLGRKIAPAHAGGHDYPGGRGVSNSARITSTVVEFDVAVTTATSDSSSAGGSGQIVIAKFGADESSSESNETVTRMKFSVPIILGGLGE